MRPISDKPDEEARRHYQLALKVIGVAQSARQKVKTKGGLQAAAELFQAMPASEDEGDILMEAARRFQYPVRVYVGAFVTDPPASNEDRDVIVGPRVRVGTGLEFGGAVALVALYLSGCHGYSDLCVVVEEIASKKYHLVGAGADADDDVWIIEDAKVMAFSWTES